MKILKTLFFASAVKGFCEETLIGEEPIRPTIYENLPQTCVNKDDDFEIRLQLECNFDFENHDPYGGYVLNVQNSVFSIFTVFGQHFYPNPPVDFTEEPQIVISVHSLSSTTAYSDSVEYFNGYGSDGKGITQKDCVEGEFMDIRVTQSHNEELNRWEREFWLNDEIQFRRSSSRYSDYGALRFNLGSSWSSHGITPLQMKNLVAKNLTPPPPPPPPPICTGFEMIPLELKANWKDAKKACQSLGAVLAYFNSEEEFETYKSTREGLARNDWLGMRKNRRGTKFVNVWRQEPSFFNWEDESDESFAGCVEILESNKWNNTDCEEKRGVICRVRGTQYC